MLILPALRIIKSSIPDIQIDCLINKSYKDISLLSNNIDNVLIDTISFRIPTPFYHRITFRKNIDKHIYQGTVGKVILLFKATLIE